ncbi:hypothetical protein BJV82DRAFT_628359 [Fennellomyces sp. T-0311]|nr:hypothetical protein BJV82DRAFT_628359 [Fennellomyces sp. T-0311]
MYFKSALLLIISALALIVAAGDCTTYIMALKAPATDKVVKQCRADVESIGGEVTYEIKTGLRALIVCLPNDQVSTFDNKDYIDFIEKDQEVHIMNDK